MSKLQIYDFDFKDPDDMGDDEKSWPKNKNHDIDIPKALSTVIKDFLNMSGFLAVATLWI